MREKRLGDERETIVAPLVDTDQPPFELSGLCEVAEAPRFIGLEGNNGLFNLGRLASALPKATANSFNSACSWLRRARAAQFGTALR